MLHSRRSATLGAAAVVAVLVAACGQPGGGAYAPASSQPTTSSGSGAPAPSAGASTSGAAVSVEVHQDATLGAFLTGEGGKSLYILTRDKPGASTCTGSCASAWPPFILQAGSTAAAGAGVSGTLTTIKRPDGTDQVAINGQPLYYFAGDSGPGQTNGQGLNGVWFLAAPGGGGVGMDGGSGGSPAPAPTYSKYNY